jgi:hypothetical protein
VAHGVVRHPFDGAQPPGAAARAGPGGGSVPPGTYRQPGSSSLQRPFRADFPELAAVYGTLHARRSEPSRLPRLWITDALEFATRPTRQIPLPWNLRIVAVIRDASQARRIETTKGCPSPELHPPPVPARTTLPFLHLSTARSGCIVPLRASSPSWGPVPPEVPAPRSTRFFPSPPRASSPPPPGQSAAKLTGPNPYARGYLPAAAAVFEDIRCCKVRKVLEVLTTFNTQKIYFFVGAPMKQKKKTILDRCRATTACRAVAVIVSVTDMQRLERGDRQNLEGNACIRRNSGQTPHRARVWKTTGLYGRPERGRR